MRSDRPNILYVHSHDTGRYVQPYGFANPAPHIQKLAEEGVLFRQAFNAIRLLRRCLFEKGHLHQGVTVDDVTGFLRFYLFAFTARCDLIRH